MAWECGNPTNRKETYMKENIKMTKSQVMASTNGLMEMFLLVTFKMI